MATGASSRPGATGWGTVLKQDTSTRDFIFEDRIRRAEEERARKQKAKDASMAALAELQADQGLPQDREYLLSMADNLEEEVVGMLNSGSNQEEIGRRIREVTRKFNSEKTQAALDEKNYYEAMNLSATGDYDPSSVVAVKQYYSLTPAERRMHVMQNGQVPQLKKIHQYDPEVFKDFLGFTNLVAEDTSTGQRLSMDDEAIKAAKDASFERAYNMISGKASIYGYLDPLMQRFMDYAAPAVAGIPEGSDEYKEAMRQEWHTMVQREIVDGIALDAARYTTKNYNKPIYTVQNGIYEDDGRRVFADKKQMTLSDINFKGKGLPETGYIKITSDVIKSGYAEEDINLELAPGHRPFIQTMQMSNAAEVGHVTGRPGTIFYNPQNGDVIVDMATIKDFNKSDGSGKIAFGSMKETPGTKFVASGIAGRKMLKRLFPYVDDLDKTISKMVGYDIRKQSSFQDSFYGDPVIDQNTGQGSGGGPVYGDPNTEVPD